MALADSVPGVSGGTIAFILGFYEDLLESINNITSRKKGCVKNSIVYLGKLLTGWIIGMICSVLFLSKMFNDNIYTLSSLFIGLTVSSIVYIVKNEKKTIEIILLSFYINIVNFFNYAFAVATASIPFCKASLFIGINLDFLSPNTFKKA